MMRVIQIADLEALAVSVKSLEIHLGLKTAPGGVLPPEFVRGFLESARLRPKWLGVWAEDAGLIIGSGMFKSAPVDGQVEIGYGVAPCVESKGVGTAICAALVSYAFEAGTTRVIAHTLPTGIASQKVLSRNRFVFAGEHDDPEDGLVFRYALEKGWGIENSL